MDSAKLASMYAQIVNGGVSKEDSQYVTDDESSALWDQVSAEVEAIRREHPRAQFAIPNEVPDVESSGAL